MSLKANYLAMGCTLVAFVGPVYAQSVVYENTTNYLGTEHSARGVQIGNEITLTGNERLITRISLGVRPLEDAPATFNARVTFTMNDGAFGNSPGTFLWASDVHAFTINGDAPTFIEFDVPNVLVPDTFIWILTKSGSPVDPSNFYPPEVGSARRGYWVSTSGPGGWIWREVAGPFGARVTAVAGTTWHVDNDTCPGPGSGSRREPFCRIQDGINEADNGDDVLVAPGVYNETINFNGKAIRLRSSDGPDVTIIDAGGLNNHVVTCDTGEGRTTLLRGFTLTSGWAAFGGGMYNVNSSPTVVDCLFIENVASLCPPCGSPAGGGMYNENANPEVTNCVFRENLIRGWGSGGGMYNVDSSPTVVGCHFERNYDSGMSNGRSSPTVIDCTFAQNERGGMRNYESSPQVLGCRFLENAGSGMVNDSRGMVNGSHGDPIVRNCTFYRNTGINGGGMNNHGSDPLVVGCVFIGNGATDSGAYGDGGAIFNHGSFPTIVNCVFSGNISPTTGGAIANYLGGNPTIINCSFNGNTAAVSGGVMSNLSNPLRKCACRPVMTNCILWGNSTPKILDEEGAETTITFSNVEGGWTGSGGNNIDVDPLFVDAPDGNLRLLPNSPCIDAGDNASVPEIVTTDLDGRPRMIDGNLDGTVIVDMGAYESQPLTLDIDPGACPNVLNTQRSGPIKMAIVGTPAFEVWELNLTSLALSRADGVGGTIQPVQRGRGRGRGIRFKDVATPFSGAPCECHDLRGDGIVDRVLTFSVREMVNAFELSALEPGMIVTLTLTGRLIDGTEFAASDCVVVNRRGRQ